MSTYVIIGLVLLILLIVILMKESYDARMRFFKLVEEAKKSYGTFNTKEISEDDLERLKTMFYRYQTEDSIDDITASDIDLDSIYLKLNNCVSAPGKEYFYFRLRTPEYDDTKITRFDEKVTFFENNREKRNELKALFLQIGNMRKTSFLHCIDLFEEIKQRNMLKEYLVIILLVISIILTCVYPTVGIVCLIGSICYNIIDYYKVRGEIESYIISFSYVSNFLKNAKSIEKVKCDAISDDLKNLDRLSKELAAFDRFSSVVTNKTGANIGAGNPLDILMDYLKMIFHIDIIIFYRMLNIVLLKKASLEEMYVCLGRIETYINVASVRASYDVVCKPLKGEGISGVNIYHPLINNPVKNSIKTNKGVLITGSNASGKSTFLKAVAINSLFAKSIYTCFADSFTIDDYRVFSSMSLRDDILNNDSYFMVEIKALKRIFDYKEAHKNQKILCFVDEVLRGTNTIERIAAVTQILKSLSEGNSLCFAATHDIELTDICAMLYDNYHFEEEIQGNDILFNYVLNPGKATSRNAIKLLSIMGFDSNLVDDASKMAEDFIREGEWRKDIACI